jgi:hypothetical protein
MGGSAFTGTKQVPDISDQVQVIVEEYLDTPAAGITTTYIAVADPTKAVDGEDWSVRRVVEDTTGTPDLITTVRWAQKDFNDANGLVGTARFVHQATSISTLPY